MEVLSTQPRGECHTIRALRRGLPSPLLSSAVHALFYYFLFSLSLSLKSAGACS